MKFFNVKNPIQIYTKTHQIAPFLKKISGDMPPNPPSKAHGFAMQISKSQKKNSWPPLPNPGDAPGVYKKIRGTPRSAELNRNYLEKYSYLEFFTLNLICRKLFF